ncbi:selenoprotein [Plasmodium yoelii yoelii]|uniref:Selenoprotein n=1 Tax=Plasmodium yoelii yoelii TaxID=73239 RepID=A0AAF0B5Z6_PLAYO|nr:selenoprotein [Plasmodium yoelii yoelii]
MKIGYDDYLGKLINIFNNICTYSLNNKKKIAKIITTSLLSGYTLNSLYNSGITFKKNPHYSLFFPSNEYIKNVFKKLKKNYEIKTKLKKDQIFERDITWYDNQSINNVEIYVSNNLKNFLSFFPNKLKLTSLYNFSKYEEFKDLKNLFNYVKVMKHQNDIFIFHGKLKKHFWIHIPMKYNITKSETGDTTTLTIIPLYKYYSDYVIEIQFVKQNNNMKFITSIKSKENNKKNTNLYYKNIIKNIAMYFTYDLFNGIHNNLDIFYKRGVKLRKISFIRPNNLLSKKNSKGTTYRAPLFKHYKLKTKRI